MPYSHEDIVLNGTNGLDHVERVPRPMVFALNLLRPQALKLALSHFDLIQHNDPRLVNWRTEAEGILVVGATVTDEDVQAASTGNLRFISKQGTGVDKIAMKKTKEAKITVMNTPGVNAQAVAELAFSMIVSLARQTPAIDRRLRAGATVTKADGWQGQLLCGKTLGVIGGGNIGLLVAKMFFGAFGGRVILYDPFLRSLDKWHSVVPESQLTFVDDIDRLYTESDVLTVHVPLTPSTENMIAAPQFKIMKRTAIVINTSRGGIINETDLADALETEEIFAAGLDAFVTEPPTLKVYSRLCENDRVLMLPHIGAACESVQESTCLAMVQNLVNAFAGRVENVV